MRFVDLGLSAPLLQALAQLGYQTPTPVQQQAIPGVLAGRDLMAAAQTGTGKTAAFALPLLQRLAADAQRAGSNSIRALVLVPTRELAEQVMSSFRGYGEGLPVSCYSAYGGVSLNPQMMRLRRGVDILVATPGRLIDLFTRNAVKFRELQTLVLDEADRMLDLGFTDDLDILFQALPKKRQTLLFSATFSDEIRSLARARLRDPLSIEVSPRNTAARTVRQWVVPCDKKRKTDLFLFMRQDRGWGQVLVFVKTKKGCDELVERLLAKQISADSIHGDRPQASRLRALEAFKAGEVQILVATDVAARGLDIDGLPQVVNFDLPLQAEDYIHRIGRTGRAGASGEAISFVCADEAPLLAAIETLLKQSLSRDEEPGFEPNHRLPATGRAGPAGAAKAPKKPKTGGQRKVPANWEGFDDFPNQTPKRPAPPRPTARPTGRSPRPPGKARGRQN